jgi:DnaJ like chaperone protein
VACAQIRTNSQQGTRVQVVRFLFDLATCDGELTERENYFIFRIAGYLNVNDVEFRKIKKEHLEQNISFYDVLGVQKDADFAEIRSVYRKLVLKYHPDKNAGATDDEKKRIAQKFLQIQDAYTKIKAERGEN